MTKEQLIALVRKNPHIRDNFTDQVVGKAIGIVYDDMVLRFHLSGGEVSSISKPFILPIKVNGPLNYNYSELPVKMINLQGAAKGVRLIEPLEDEDVCPYQGTRFVPVTLEAARIHNDIGTMGITSIVPYSVAGEQIRYYRRFTKLGSVLVHIVVSFDDLEDTDNIPTVLDQTKLLSAVMEYFGVQPKEDSVDLNTKQ